ncbi:MAG: hypothetical protein JO189_19630 [Deltaproteobacteria bacterium]|nr:hypothetical protein [Deltaproteobacteria bacterium]
MTTVESTNQNIFEVPVRATISNIFRQPAARSSFVEEPLWQLPNTARALSPAPLTQEKRNNIAMILAKYV